MPTESEDKAAIEAVIQRLFDSYRSRDMELMLSVYASDLVTMMPFGQPTYGLEAWREVLHRAFGNADIDDIDHDIQEILLFGDWAWEWHLEWSVRRIKKTGELSPIYVRAAQLFRRQPDGEWKVARYIGNAVPIEGDVEEHKRMVRAPRN